MKNSIPTVTIASLCLLGCGGTETSEDVTADVSDVQTTTCPDGLVLWEEYNVCAPRVDDCENPWELPIIGGGCMAIGPRGRPKLWDPDSDVDCEPGELMTYDGSACPVGFVLTDDEVACIPFFDENCGEMEIPVLGGGCKKVGPDVNAPGAMTAETGECPPGTLMTRESTCVRLGPRACPLLWDPEGEKECLAGATLPCPPGWDEAGGGLYCRPSYDDDCPAGERPLLGGGCGRVTPTEQDCPLDQYANVPEDASDVMYVSADSGCTDACGSPEAPWSSIQAAVDFVPEGGTVMVGPGTYQEGVRITKPVQVIGSCAPLVKVAGSVAVGDKEPKLDSTGILVLETEDVRLSGLAVLAPAAGVTLLEAGTVTLDSIEIAHSVGVGLAVLEGSSVEVSTSWIHGVVTQVGSSTLGVGIWVHTDSHVTVRGSLVEDTSPFGVASVAHSHVVMEESVVRDNKWHKSLDLALGLIAASEGRIDLRQCLLERNADISVLVSGKDSRVDVVDTLVRDPLPVGLEQKLGCGFWFEDGAGAGLSRSLVARSHGAGIVATQLAGPVMLDRVAVVDTSESLNWDSDGGVHAALGSDLEARGCHFEANSGAGLIARDEGTFVTARYSVFRDGTPRESGIGGWAGQVSGGAAMELEAILLSSNTIAGLNVLGIGTWLSVRDSILEGTRTLDGFLPGAGLLMQGGAHANLYNSVIQNNQGYGVTATGAGTRLELEDSVVAFNGCDSCTLAGGGLEIQDGAKSTVTACRLHGNSLQGGHVIGDGSRLQVDASLVSRTMPVAQNDSGPGYGPGLVAQEGASAIVSKSLVVGNTALGVGAFGSSAIVQLESSVVRGTEPAADAGLGYGAGLGVGAFEGGEATLVRCLVQDSVMAGVGALEPGSHMGMQACIVRDSRTSNQLFGMGAVAAGGAGLEANGCLFEDNRSDGVAVFKNGSNAVLSDSIIRATQSDEKGQSGDGLSVSGESAASVTRCLVVGNSTAGVRVSGQDSKMQLHDSLVAGTKSAGMWVGADGSREFQLYGDGAVVSDGASLETWSSVFAHNDRAGLYFAKASGYLEGCLVAGNDSFGLAMEKSVEDVQYVNAGNFLFGNAGGLPAAMAAETTTEPRDMPVPPPPVLPDL